MKPQLLFAAVLIMSTAWGNPIDSLPGKSDPAMFVSTYKPAFRLTAKDIERLPFTNIMEVINGRFPFVFADPPSASAYTWLVDGYVALNVNAINVSQIALIEFYPVSFDAGSGSLSSRGTFVISTKASKPGVAPAGFVVRSQGGVILPTEKTYGPPGSGLKHDVENDYFTHQEVGYNHAGSKFRLSAGVSYTRNPNPSFTLSNDQNTFNQTYEQQYNRWRVSAMGDYYPIEKLRISLALAGALLKYETAGETGMSGTNVSNYNSGDVKYGGVAAAVEYRHSPGFTNTLQFEYAPRTSDMEAHVVNFGLPPGGPNPDIHRFDKSDQEFKRMAVINTAKGIFNANRPVEFGWQVILRYHRLKEETSSSSRLARSDGTTILYNDSHFDRKDRTSSIMPGISVRIKKNFVAQAGAVWDSWQGPGFPSVNNDEWLPYGGISWNIPMSGNGLSSLEFHSTYGKALQFNYRADQLDTYSKPGYSQPSGPFSNYGQIEAGYNWITGVNAGFAQNRIMASVNYLRGNAFPLVYISTFGGGYFVDYREVERSGVSVDVQAAIAQSEDFSCKLRTILFYERIELKEGQYVRPLIYQDNPFLNDDISPQWRGSASLDINAGNFFLQAVGMIRFKDEGYTAFPFSATRNTMSNHGLTFLVAGYTIHTKNNKQWDLSVQTRNLAVMKEPRAGQYYGSRYVGLGVNVNL